MTYEIKGIPLPVVECHLEANESVKCESGSMGWMTSNMEMTTSGGGLGKMFSRAFSGESLFQNIYTAKGSDGSIAFTSSFPGKIVAVELSDGKELVCQKSAFLASTMGIELSVFFQKKLGAGFFGGEGFVMQKISGNGTVFLEFDGEIIEKELAAGEKLVLDTGYLAMIDATCKIDIESVKGLKNKFLGGEGWFNTTVTGPGKVYIQTMPACKVAGTLKQYIVTDK